jgi:hypothetical protein
MHTLFLDEGSANLPMKLVLVNSSTGVVIREILSGITFDRTLPVLSAEFEPPAFPTEFRLVSSKGETVQTFFDAQLKAGGVYTLIHALNKTGNRATFVLEQPPQP